MNKLRILIISIILITLGCSKDDLGIRLSGFETPIVTGYVSRSIQGQPVRDYGTPNIKLGNESNDNTSEYYFLTYPNPCKDHCNVYIKAPNPNSAKRIWIVKAQFQDIGTDIGSNLGSNALNTGGYPVIESEFTTESTAMDLGTLSDGYYRIYLNIGGHILYDNLVISNNIIY